MPPPDLIWPRHIIRELCVLAHSVGEARSRCASAREAVLLRTAIYNFRRRNPIGLGLRITIEDGREVVLRAARPSVEILPQTPNLECAS